MRTMKVALLAVSLPGAVSLSFAQQATAPPAVLGDGAGAVSKRVDIHQTRYIEIFLAAKEPTTGPLVAACFNTMYTSAGVPVSKDTAPQALVPGLDFENMHL